LKGRVPGRADPCCVSHASKIWYWQLKDKCIKPDGSRALVVDVGGNFGWYSLFAASLGCRVIAWEPVPHFRDFFLYGVALNNFTHLIQVQHSLEHALKISTGDSQTVSFHNS
jgi:hypothetical protein